jgi:hypothetical protein
VFVETLVGDEIDVVAEWLPIHDLETVTMDIAKLQRVWFDWAWEVLISFL